MTTFSARIDWKPPPATKITIEVQANHYKSDTFFTLDPKRLPGAGSGWNAGLPRQLTPALRLTVSLSAPPATPPAWAAGYTSATNYTILSPANKPGGLPIINPACAVVTSYMRYAPTRIWTPTETLRFQSSALKNISMNGNVHYTRGSSDMPNYYENAQGLTTLATNGTANRSVIWTGGHATAQHSVIGADFGIIWQATPTVSLADQATYSSTHEPSNSIIPPQTALADSRRCRQWHHQLFRPARSRNGLAASRDQRHTGLQLLWPGISDQQSDCELGSYRARAVCSHLPLQQPQHRPGRSPPGSYSDRAERPSERNHRH